MHRIPVYKIIKYLYGTDKSELKLSLPSDNVFENQNIALIQPDIVRQTGLRPSINCNHYLY
jgi:hypothetical protein